MKRCFAFMFALLFASLSVASACAAGGGDWIGFTLQLSRDGKEIRTEFRRQRDSRRTGDHEWSTNFNPPQLIGLDVSSFRGAGTRPLRFALVRDAGRLDCSGQGGAGHARGECRATAAAGFLQMLHSRGIGRPTSDQVFGLIALDARRELVEAIAAAGYSTPSLDDLMALSALGVNGTYVRGLASVGFRPATIETLVQFKALNITPEYIGGFRRLGYRDIPGDKFVQLKALGITPEFVRAVGGDTDGQPSIGDLVHRKLLGRRR